MTSDRIIKTLYDILCFGFVILLILVFFHALVAMEIGIVIFLIFLLCLVPWIFKSQNDVETAHTAEEKIKALEKRIKALEGQSNNQNDNSQLIKPF